MFGFNKSFSFIFGWKNATFSPPVDPVWKWGDNLGTQKWGDNAGTEKWGDNL